jgi:hypothetical protein
MPYERPNELASNEAGEPSGKMRGGYERIARRFLSAPPGAVLIRIDAHDARRALSRRQLGRLIDPRRVVS